MRNMKYTIEENKIAIIQQSEIDKRVLKKIRTLHGYKDTNTQFNEVIIAVCNFHEISFFTDKEFATDLPNLIDELWQQLKKFDYVLIINDII